DLTDAGYPFVVKMVKRGEPLDNAKEVFRGERTDALVNPRVLRDPDGRVRAVMVERRVGFFESENYLVDGPQPVKLPLPPKTNFQAFVDGAVIFKIEEDWSGF